MIVNLYRHNFGHSEFMDMSDHSPTVQKHHDLMARYVNICNEAMLLNRNRFPFKQILGAAKQSEKGQPVEIILEDTQPQEIYVFHLNENGISVQPHADCPDCECVRKWKTSIPYLTDITEDPQSYIENPARINWEWMYNNTSRT